MKEATVRIGDKNKSVRIKKYLLDFYCKAIYYVDLEGATKRAKEILDEGCKKMPNEFVTADYVYKHMLLDIEEEMKPGGRLS